MNDKLLYLHFLLRHYPIQVHGFNFNNTNEKHPDAIMLHNCVLFFNVVTIELVLTSLLLLKKPDIAFNIQNLTF